MEQLDILGTREVSPGAVQRYLITSHIQCSLVTVNKRAALVQWWVAGMVICLERGADFHIAQLMPLPLTVSCFSKVQISFTFLVLAHPDSPGQIVVKRVCVCVWFSELSLSFHSCRDVINCTCLNTVLKVTHFSW